MGTMLFQRGGCTEIVGLRFVLQFLVSFFACSLHREDHPIKQRHLRYFPTIALINYEGHFISAAVD